MARENLLFLVESHEDQVDLKAWPEPATLAVNWVVRSELSCEALAYGVPSAKRWIKLLQRLNL